MPSHGTRVTQTGLPTHPRSLSGWSLWGWPEIHCKKPLGDRVEQMSSIQVSTWGCLWNTYLRLEAGMISASPAQDLHVGQSSESWRSFAGANPRNDHWGWQNGWLGFPHCSQPVSRLLTVINERPGGTAGWTLSAQLTTKTCKNSLW